MRIHFTMLFLLFFLLGCASERPSLEKCQELSTAHFECADKAKNEKEYNTCVNSVKNQFGIFNDQDLLDFMTLCQP